MEIVQSIGKRAYCVDKPAIYRLLAVYDAADIVGYLVGGEHQLVVFFTADVRVSGYKAHYALLNARKIVVGLRNSDDHAV